MVKRVLITGGSGFIGTNLVNSLIKLDYDIVVVDIKNFDKKNNLFHLRKKENFKYLKYDLFKKKLYNKIKKKVNIVIHLASGVGVNSYIKDPYNLIMSIFNPTVNLLDFSIKHKAHFIFASTSEIYGRNSEFPWKESDDRVLGPTTISRWSYSTVKATCEHLIFGFKKKFPKFNFTIVRFFNVYGPHQRSNFIISSFVQNIIRNKKINIYDKGKMMRCFTFIDDAVNCLIKIFNNKKVYNEILNIGSSKEYEILEVKKILETYIKKRIKYKMVDTKKLYKNKYEDIPRRIPDVSKIYNKVGWKATTSLKDGLIKTYNFYKKKI